VQIIDSTVVGDRGDGGIADHGPIVPGAPQPRIVAMANVPGTEAISKWVVGNAPTDHSFFPR